ncbi:hypothetical protein Tco_0356118 [Tanacetum coccineum]
MHRIIALNTSSIIHFNHNNNNFRTPNPKKTPNLATTTSSSLQNLPNFASLFGFDHRLKALEDNFSESRQTNQYAEALSSIPSTVDQYLAHKMQEAVDVAVQLKYDRIREESSTANQQFLETIDDGMKKIIKEQVKKEVSKIIPKVEKFVNDRLESEVLVRSSKEANTSHVCSCKSLRIRAEKDLKFLQDGNIYNSFTVTIKRPRDGADDDEEPSTGIDRGSKRRRSGKEPASTSAPSETTTKTVGKTTSTGSKTHKKSASQSVSVGEAMHSTDVFKGPADQEFETGVQDEQAEEEVQHLPDWFQKPTRLPSPDHAWNTSVPAVHETVQPCACSFMLCDLDFEPLSLSLSSLPSCDLMSLTNMLILLHYLESLNQMLAEVLFHLDIQLTSLSPRNCIPPEVPFSEYQGIRHDQRLKMLLVQSQNPLDTRVPFGSIVPLVKPLDIRKFDSSSYQALGACFNPTKAFLEGRLFLDDLDQRTLSG